MTTPSATRDPAAFWALRETPLHEMTPALWQDYYPAMAPWLYDADAQIRDCAIERLMTAVFWSEFWRGPQHATRDEAAKARLAWLLSEIERAHAIHPDIIPRFLVGLRYQGDDEPYTTPLLAWLDSLDGKQSHSIDAGLLQGTRLMVSRNSKTLRTDLTQHMALLDHPSDYVRGCAAYLLGNVCDEETEPDKNTLFHIVGAKERARPGIAGPFWSPQHTALDAAEWQHVTQWMLDLLEQRKGAPPWLPFMPFNDIEFHLHELCCRSPEHKWRILRGGHAALALMTATEIAGRVEGVEPVLRSLAEHTDPRIAAAASRHLAAHYETPPAP